MPEEFPTLLDLGKKALEAIEKFKTAKKRRVVDKEVKELEKKVAELKTEKEIETEKAKLIAEIKALEKEIEAKKKVGEIVA